MAVITARPGETVTLKAALAMATAYGTWASDWLYCAKFSEVEFRLDYNQDDETTIELQIDTAKVTADGAGGTPTADATGYTGMVVGSEADGVSDLEIHELVITKARVAADPAYLSFRWKNQAQVSLVRIRAKNTGGASPPTLALHACGG